ncbi:RlpA-like double-psi beta-barrel-protein domain-containing protein-containing protein [Astrocystis sublimbata]|nr:RlpA-like double-psi beta-barrel-protein domain-containing protein-containing protein [Astrocystis sublimbata]
MVSFTKTVVAMTMAVTSAFAFSGDMTYYNPGLGACGWTNGDGDAVVALSPSKSGNCGRQIRIHYNGKSTTAKVVDKCPGCGDESIDVSPTVFDQLANRDQGRVHVTWEFI